MGLDADAIVDRRRLKRSRALWRFLAVLAVLLLILAEVADIGAGQTHVARLTIANIIIDDDDVIEAIDEVTKDDSVAGVVLAIDSPGGTVTGAEALYDALRRLAEKKPMVATMGSMAASGGYIVALSADHILARRNSITGSIGVIMQAPEVSGLLQKLGITMTEIKSAPLKGEPSEFHPMSEEGRKATQALVADAYEWFVGLVAERRRLKPEEARGLGDGRVFSGGQAVANKLVDGLGDEKTARAWLASSHGVAETLPIRDVDLSDRVGPFKIPSGSGAVSLVLTALTGKSLESKRLTLDGLLAIWHPQG